MMDLGSRIEPEKAGHRRIAVYGAIAAIAYACLSLAYFIFFDRNFYLKDLFGCGIALAVPVPYIALTAILIFSYASILKKKPERMLVPVAAMAVVLALACQLAYLKIGAVAVNPFSWNRGVYRMYSEGYCFGFLAIFSVFSGSFFYRLSRGTRCGFLGASDSAGHRIIFHLPVFLYSIFIASLLAFNGLGVWAGSLSAVFLVFAFSGLANSLADNMILKAKKIIRNEWFFLVMIFLLAFAIRYLWGLRVSSLLGEKFIFASDDGQAYDKLASMIAGGGGIPKSDAFCLNGFGYWYFLAAVYKIFGIRNFGALIVIQSLLASSVPVFVYLIAKNAFKTGLAAVIASIIASFNLTLAFLSSVICMEALYIPLFFLALTAASYFLTDNRPVGFWKTFLMGGLFGLANNARGELLFAPFILSAIILIFMRRKGWPGNVALSIISIFLGFMLFAGIQHIATYLIYGEYHLTYSNVTGNFSAIRYGGENARLAEMGFNPFKDFGSSVNLILKQPLEVPGLVLKSFSRRIFIYYLQPNFGVFDPIFLVNPSSGYFFAFPVYLQMCGYIFIIGGILAAFFKKEMMAFKAAMLAFILYISSIYAFIMLQNSRNRGVLIPIGILFLSYGIAFFLHKLKSAYQGGR